MYKIISFIFLIFLSNSLYSQYFNIEPDLKIGTGKIFFQAQDTVNNIRTRTYIQLDTSMIVDYEKDFQWGIGMGVEFETRLAFFPGIYVKLIKHLKLFDIFGMAGIEYMIVPETSFGFRLGGGVKYKFIESFYGTFHIDLKPHIFGSDLGETMIFYINFLFGVAIIL